MYSLCKPLDKINMGVYNILNKLKIILTIEVLHMSLAIHTIVKNGIVVCADSRITITKKGDVIRYDNPVRYDDTANKIIPFPNGIVVTAVGDDCIFDEWDIDTYLLGFRRSLEIRPHGLYIEIDEFAPLLFEDLTKKIEDIPDVNEIELMISGYNHANGKGKTYKINIKGENRNISVCRNYGEYGASFSGHSNMAETMLHRVVYKIMSLQEAIDLTKTTLSAVVAINKYQIPQSTGGKVNTYVIDTVRGISGWLEGSSMIPDPEAPYGNISEIDEKQALANQRSLCEQCNNNIEWLKKRIDHLTEITEKLAGIDPKDDDFRSLCEKCDDDESND